MISYAKSSVVHKIYYTNMAAKNLRIILGTRKPGMNEYYIESIFADEFYHAMAFTELLN